MINCVKFIIDKINCKQYKMTCIGQIKNPLHLRINLHRSNIKPYNNHNIENTKSFNAEFSNYT